jgi:hypothetical protein
MPLADASTAVRADILRGLGMFGEIVFLAGSGERRVLEEGIERKSKRKD